MKKVIKFKVNDRVRINPKGEYPQQGRGLGTITQIEPTSSVILVLWDCGSTNTYRSGDLIKDGEVTEMKIFKQLRDSERCRKGALWEEAFDNTYIMKDTSFMTYTYSNGVLRLVDCRDAVEKQPKWFVQVFKTSPEYATEDEIIKFGLKKVKVGK